MTNKERKINIIAHKRWKRHKRTKKAIKKQRKASPIINEKSRHMYLYITDDICSK